MSVLLAPYARVRTSSATAARFFHADCLDVFGQLTPGSVDVIVTSPPYNIGLRYNQYDDTLSREDYLEWTAKWVAAAARVLRPDGSLFLNVGAKPSDPWTALDVAQAARAHLQLQNIIHWIKSIAIEKASAGAAAGLSKDLAVGHYKPINSDRFVNDCQEFVFHFTPQGATPLDRLALGVPYQDPSNVGRWRAAADGVRCRGNTWFIPYETIQRRDRDRPHPATFPTRLPEQCLRLHGLSRAKVAMDPFTGLGSTAVACARLGVDFIGSDVDETYLKEAVARTTDAAARRMARASSSSRASAAPSARIPSAPRR
ncbi:MAG TPA: site-specific DNA-methyltransferase [Vicinamibacterales bacterium]|nr:site-specific DNA-methyltransferase [Vicinamibacterales bacterium]